MLRLVYLRVVRLHPDYFCERFGDEMLSIFDHTQGRMARARLVADGLLSLARQWMLRPHYVQGSVPALPNGAPGFHLFHNFKPRTLALIEGVLLTAVTFTFVCLTMGYNWRHPMLIPIKPPHWEVRKPAHAPLYYPPIAEPLPTEPLPSVPTRKNSGKTSLPGVLGAKASFPGIALPVAPIPLDTLGSYVGKYALEPPDGGNVLITLANGVLSLQMPGHPPIVLVPLSKTNFSASAESDLRIAFEKPNGSRLQIHRNGHEFMASRQSK